MKQTPIAMLLITTSIALLAVACGAPSEEDRSTAQVSEALAADGGPGAPAAIVPDKCEGKVLGDGIACMAGKDYEAQGLAFCKASSLPVMTGSLAGFCGPESAKLAFVSCCSATGKPLPPPLGDAAAPPPQPPQPQPTSDPKKDPPPPVAAPPASSGKPPAPPPTSSSDPKKAPTPPAPPASSGKPPAPPPSAPPKK